MAESWECRAASARSGDRRAVNGLLDALSPYLMKIARSIAGPDPDDLVQLALVAVWRGLPRYDTGRPFLSWARVVGRRAMLTAARLHRRECGFEDGFGLGVADRPPEHRATDGLPFWWLPEVTGGLSSDEREALGMRFGLVGGGRTVTGVGDVQGRCRQHVSAGLSDSLAAVRVAFEVRYGQPA